MRGYDYEMMDGWHHFFSGWWLLWGLIPLLFWIVLLGLIAWGVSRMFYIQRGKGPELPDQQWSQAEQILRERFARGEIDTEEYKERSRILSGDHNNYGSPP